MGNLSPTQQKVVRQLIAAAQGFGASPREKKALLEAGSVESNFTPLTGGDADSTGVLQQRPSQGWGPVGESVETDARQFLKAARAQHGVSGSAGDLAAAVQRPKAEYRGRYDEAAPTAASLLGGSGGAPGAADPDASGAGAGAEPGSTAGVEALLAAMQPQAQPRRAGALAAPSFSAQPTLASGAQVPSGGGGGGAAPSGVDALLNAATIVGQQPTGPAAPSGPDAPSSGQVKGAKLGDPVVGGTSIGGEHETSGLSGYPARDYFAPAGSDAVAPVSGKVVKLSGHDPKDGPTNGPHGPLGWSVYVKGSDGKTYFLTHLGSRTVKVGERVDAGQEIGTVANYDKYGTPSHVHMGVRG